VQDKSEEKDDKSYEAFLDDTILSSLKEKDKTTYMNIVKTQEWRKQVAVDDNAEGGELTVSQNRCILQSQLHLVYILPNHLWRVSRYPHPQRGPEEC
jgi:hypothetical protein